MTGRGPGAGSPPVVLTVAGTDSGGAAGVAADLATLSHLGVHGACVVTAVTAQDTTGVSAVHAVPPAVVAAQVAAVTDDLVVRLVADRLGHVPLVVDPVLVATSGAVLGGADVSRAYAAFLLPRATVATPNRDEALALTGREAPSAELAARLADLGCAVVLTGGPEWRAGEGEAGDCVDWLCLPGGAARALLHPVVATTHDHGTGCTFSSALAAGLAHGCSVEEAVVGATAYVTEQLRRGAGWSLGRGRGPVAHVVPSGCECRSERQSERQSEPQGRAHR